MKHIYIFLICMSCAAYGQLDTNYIRNYRTHETLQFHVTHKNARVYSFQDGSENLLFRSNSLGAGVFFRYRIFELFLTIPIFDFGNYVHGSSRTLNPGFSVNLFPRDFHVSFDFKYFQGYENIKEILSKRLKILQEHSSLYCGRLKLQYIQNSNRFSLPAIIQFEDLQKKSAGSIIYSVPIGFLFLDLHDQALTTYRIAVGAMAGYGYTHVYNKWRFSAFIKGGVEVQHSNFGEREDFSVSPAVNGNFSMVYDLGGRFIGLTSNYYPEFHTNDANKIRLQDNRIRIFIGKRFGKYRKAEKR